VNGLEPMQSLQKASLCAGVNAAERMTCGGCWIFCGSGAKRQREAEKFRFLRKGMVIEREPFLFLWNILEYFLASYPEFQCLRTSDETETKKI